MAAQINRQTEEAKTQIEGDLEIEQRDSISSNRRRTKKQRQDAMNEKGMIIEREPNFNSPGRQRISNELGQYTESQASQIDLRRSLEISRFDMNHEIQLINNLNPYTFVLKYQIANTDTDLNAILIKQPFNQNLIEILEQDSSLIERQNINQIRIFNEKIGSFVKIEASSYQKEVDFGEFLNLNMITGVEKEIKIKILLTQQLRTESDEKDEKQINKQNKQIEESSSNMFEKLYQQIEQLNHKLTINEEKTECQINSINSTIQKREKQLEQYHLKLEKQEKQIIELENTIKQLKDQKKDEDNLKQIEIVKNRKLSLGNAKQQSDLFGKFFGQPYTIHEMDVPAPPSIRSKSLSMNELMPKMHSISKYASIQPSQIENIQQMSGMSKQSSFSTTSNTNEIPDLVYFYSEPLVEKLWNEKKQMFELVSSGWAQLQTDIEYMRLIQILKATDKDFKIMKQAINFESLKQMIARKPKIIHISCHGDFDKVTNEFYLQFEEIGNGISDRFCQSRLIELLGSEQDHGIKLAFVSACHSEEIGKILFKCKIPLVISVNSESQVADEICLLFSRHLYMQLLQGHSIQKSFEEAQRTCKASPIDCKSCCCAHDHTPQCKWQKYANFNGYEKAHNLHSGKCLCTLGNNKHKKNCNLYVEFTNFLRDWKDPDQIIKAKPKENIWAFDDDFDFDNFENHLISADAKDEEEEFIICCCHKEIPHDESSKFQLKADEKNLSLVLFRNRFNGGQITQLHQMNSQIKLSQNYDQSWLIGRNLEIQSCVEMLINNNYKNNKIIKVYGKSGCGRLLIAKKAAKYVMDRGYFTNGAYEIDADSTYNVSGFMQQMFQTMRLSNMNNIEDFIDLIQEKEMIIIINNISRILKNDKQKFLNLIFDLNDKTEDIKLIVIIQKQQDLDFQGYEKTKFIRSNNLQINPLKKQFGIEFLLSQDKNNEVITKQIQDQLQIHSIFNLVLSNRQIQETFMLLKSGQTLDEIESIYKSEIQKVDDQDASINHAKQKMYDIQLILFKSMERIYQDEQNLLFLICQAPNGLTTKDILDIVSLHPWRYGNWAHFLDSCLFETRALNLDENVDNQSTHPNEVEDENHHGFQVVYQKQGQGINENISFIQSKIRDFINEVVLINNRKHYLKAFLTYLSKLSRQYLRNMITNSFSDFNINILSCIVDDGLWDKIRISPLDHLDVKKQIENKTYIENVDARFAINEDNFAEGFNFDVITNVFKKKLNWEDDNQEDQYFSFLDELYCCYVSILILKNREKDALIMIEMGDQICKHLNLEQTSAKLSLISLSLQIKNQNIFDIQNKLVNINEVFKRNFNKPGQAETHFLKSVWLICKLNHQRSEKEITIDKIQILKKKKSSTFGEIILPQHVVNELNQTQVAFRKLNQSIGEARVILLKANFFESNFKEEQKNFESILPDLLKAELIFGKNQHYQLQTQCMIFISIIYLQQENYQLAKEYIHKGISQARENKDNQQLQVANTILEEIQIKIQMKCNNLIVCLNSFPLVSVHKQNQLSVTKEENKVEVLQAHNYISQDIDRFCNRNILGKQGKSLVYKQEFLNKDSLEYLKNYGCRVLIIKQTVFDQSNNLCIENNFGELEIINSSYLKSILKPKEGKLNVDVVFINIKNGIEIAKVFQELGVRQVFTYQDENDSTIFNQIYDTNFYEFMGQNSMEILKNLINQQSYYRAQETAKTKSKQIYSKSFTSSMKWEGSEGNLKLFDDQSVDERLMIHDGMIEDQTQELGPNNLTTSYGPMIGRKVQMHSIIKDILGDSIQLVKISGIKGIGKTRFVKEIAHHIHLRKLMPNGVYYLDFKNICSQSQINDLFKQEGIQFILEMEENEKQQKNNQIQQNQKILLVYDNIDIIQSYDTIFKWHIQQLIKFFPKVKVLMTQNVKSQTNGASYYMHSNKMREIKLQPLSLEDSVSLVMMYCIRDVKESEFDVIKQELQSPILKKNQTLQDYNSPLPDLTKQKTVNLNEHDKIIEKFSTNINILLCEGNPEALIMLALILRSTQMNNIEVFQKKINRQNQLNIQQNIISQEDETRKSFVQDLNFLQQRKTLKKQLQRNLKQSIKKTVIKLQKDKKQSVVQQKSRKVKTHLSMNNLKRSEHFDDEKIIKNQLSKEEKLDSCLDEQSLKSNNDYDLSDSQINSPDKTNSPFKVVNNLDTSLQMNNEETISNSSSDHDNDSGYKESNDETPSKLQSLIDSNTLGLLTKKKSLIKNLPKINLRSTSIVEPLLSQLVDDNLKRQNTSEQINKAPMSLMMENLKRGILQKVNEAIQIKCINQPVDIINSITNSDYLNKSQSYRTMSQIQVFANIDEQFDVEIFKHQDYQFIQILENLDFGALKEHNEQLGILNSVQEMKKLLVDVFKQKSLEMMVLKKRGNQYLDFRGNNMIDGNSDEESHIGHTQFSPQNFSIMNNIQDQQTMLEHNELDESVKIQNVRIEIPVLKINHILKKHSLIGKIRAKEFKSSQFGDMRHSIDLKTESKYSNIFKKDNTQNMDQIQEISDEHIDNNSEEQKSFYKIKIATEKDSSRNDDGYNSNFSSNVEDQQIVQIINLDPDPEELIKKKDRKLRKQSRRDKHNYDLEDSLQLSKQEDQIQETKNDLEPKNTILSMKKQTSVKKKFEEDKDFKLEEDNDLKLSKNKKFVSFQQKANKKEFTFKFKRKTTDQNKDSNFGDMFNSDQRQKEKEFERDIEE